MIVSLAFRHLDRPLVEREVMQQGVLVVGYELDRGALLHGDLVSAKPHVGGLQIDGLCRRVGTGTGSRRPPGLNADPDDRSYYRSSTRPNRSLHVIQTNSGTEHEENVWRNYEGFTRKLPGLSRPGSCRFTLGATLTW
jgi:hypothetical protein